MTRPSVCGVGGVAVAPDVPRVEYELPRLLVARIRLPQQFDDVGADGLPIGLAGGDDLPPPFLLTGVAVEANGSIIFSSDIENAIYRVNPQ